MAIVLLVPVSELVAVSVAVIVWLPAVSSVALKVPLPLLRVLFDGNDGRAIGAGEMDGAAVARNRVVELVLGRHREAETVARGGDRRGADGEVSDRCRR